jgi:voltage-gated potassium channel
MSLYARRLLLGFGFVLLLTVLGVAGFMSLEHESLVDALLTTVSAISTVGYSPPHPFSTSGKILAIVLILGGIFAIALVISVLTEYLVEGHLYGSWARRKMERSAAELRDHYIIAGFGRVGREVGSTLALAKVPFIVLDINLEVLEEARKAGYLFMSGDPTRDTVLMKVGIQSAKGLIACSDSDTNNVYITLTARSLNPEIFIVARAAFPDAEPRLYQAGANRVVSPYVMAGRHMAQVATNPHVSDEVSAEAAQSGNLGGKK